MIKVGFIGLGRIGTPMAANVREDLAAALQQLPPTKGAKVTKKNFGKNRAER